MDTRDAVRHIVAAFLLVAALYLSFFVASLIGWSFDPPGWNRVTESATTLLLSFAIAETGVVVARLVTERSALSWWLLVGFVPPLYWTLSEGGVL